MPDAYTRAAAAYGSAGRVAIDQRDMEANALLKAARALEDIRTAWSDDIGPRLEEALLYNRKLWVVFATEAGNAENPLPRDIRTGIANLAIFVFKRTIEVQAAPDAGKIDALIEINKSIAAGLLERPDPANVTTTAPTADTPHPAPPPTAA